MTRSRFIHRSARFIALERLEAILPTHLRTP